MNINEIVKNSRMWTWTVRLRKRHGRAFLFFYLYAAAVYLPLLALRLTNDMDGLWGQDDYIAGTWELSIGRWFWPWLDHARFQLSLDPLPGLLALVLYTAGFMILAGMTGGTEEAPSPAQRVHYPFTTIAAGCLFLAGTGISCQMSYSYMVITFAASFFLAVLSVYVVAGSAGGSREREEKQQRTGRNQILRILCGALLTAVMMGCYQSSIGVTAIAAMFVFLHILSLEKIPGRNSARAAKSAQVKAALRFALSMLISIALGAVLYELLLHLHYAAFHTEAASYQGFAEITPLYILQHLPQSIRHTYTALKAWLGGAPFKFNILQEHKIFRLVYLVPALMLLALWIRTLRRNLWSGILFAAGCALIPLFANCFFLLAPDAETQMQTTVPMSLIMPLIFCLTGNQSRNCAGVADSESGRLEGKAVSGTSFGGTAAALAFLAAAFFLIYGAVAQVEVDSYAMYAGRRASETLAKSMAAEMQASGQDYLDGQMQVIGCPARAQTFAVKDLYNRANSYAQYGNWPEANDTARICWSRLYDNELRMKVSYVFTDTADSIAATPEVAAMPVWPAAGSVQNIYGVTVIKLYQP